jgi:hypothetical protein
MKYTPGPWKIMKGVFMGTYHLCTNVITEEEDEANACLIATAPELLDALQSFVSACETAPPIEFINYIDNACKQAKLAIAKAEGKP